MIDYKKIKAPGTTITQNMNRLDDLNGNIYEAVSIISRRANQISMEIREELQRKLSEYATATDNLEEVHENKEQIEVSKYYEQLPKATSIAIQEWLDGKIYYRRADDGLAATGSN